MVTNKVFRWALPVCALSLFIASCDKFDSQQAGEEDNTKVVATYNQGKLTEGEVNEEIAKLMNQNPEIRNNNISYETLDPAIRQTVIKEIIAQRLLAQEAADQGFEDKPDVRKRIESATSRILAQEYIIAKGEELVTEEKIRAFYDEQVNEYTQKEEYHASHILLKTEAEAKKVLAQVNKDKSKFAEIAKEKSVDATKVRGGDLGYFVADVMVPEFAEAVKNMKVDEVAGPIQTDFGWHIVWLQDRRQAVPISYEKARPRIERDLRQEAVKDYVDEAVAQANIDYLDGQETEQAEETAESSETADAASVEQAPESAAADEQAEAAQDDAASQADSQNQNPETN